MSEIEALATTLRAVAKPGMKPKELFVAVREKHSDAKKKDIVRAAFYALTHAVEHDAEKVKHLHDFALTERTSEDEAPVLSKKPRKKDRRKEPEVPRSTH